MAENISQQTNILHFPPSSLGVVSALIMKANLLISPDTSLVHIASTFDISQITLANNSPAHLIKFAPFSTINRVIIPHNDKKNVPFISVEQVLEKFEEIQNLL
jgi:ADP-heptose:LPS heptosyltransferase